MNKSPGIIAPFSDRSSRPRLISEANGTPALVVLGMHRSGTSALTRVLSLSGYALPSTLMEAAPDNEEGFWESRPISELNDQLLKRVGSSWDDPFGFSPANSVTSIMSGHRDEAVQLIREVFPSSGPLVLKDPRITVLYDFWRDVLHEAGYEAVPVIAVRHPLEVAASLAKRNKFPTNKSLLIWMSYQLAAEQATRESPRAFVMYDDLMSDWRSCLDRLEQSLGFSLPRRDPEAELQIERFLRPELRHHVAVDQRESARRDVPAWVRDAYEWLKAAAGEGAPDPAALNAAVAEYTRQRKWFGPLIADLRLELASAVKQAAEEVRMVETRLLEADAAYKSEIAVRDAGLQRQNEVLAKADANVRELQALLAEREGQLSAAGAGMQAAEQEAAKLRAQVLEIERVRAVQIAALDRDATALRERISEIEAQSQAAQEAANQRVREVEASATAQANTYRNDIAALREQIEAAQAAADQRVREVEASATSQSNSYRNDIAALRRQIDDARAANDLGKANMQDADFRHRAEIAQVNRVYEAERARREEEIRGEVLNAQNVIASLQSDLIRAQTLVRERGQVIDRLISENHEIRSSTLWRVLSPVRWFGQKLPFLSRAVRGARSAAGAIVRGKGAAPGKGEPASASPPATPSVAPAARPLEAATVTSRTAINPEPIAQYLMAEHGEPAHAEAWRQHCARFALPIDPDSNEKPNLALSEEDAAEWMRRCREAGAHLPPMRETPDVSIIIPVYNQLAFTLSAVASVYALKTGLTYEILIGDDASSDQTRLLADAGLPRVRVVRHSKNVGFLLNCNIAAEQATGAYIVLLNNDTVVLPNWLDEMIGTLKADPKVGLVGSKLLYANGTLQEAGGIVWQDGSAWNWGRNQDPRDPRYCYLREVDYCSGASIALPKDLWRQLGGFDGAVYENSYYEDVDLAFRVREAGRKVIYQPLSAVVHFEGVSSGVDVTAGTKKYQTANGERFLKRWRDTLHVHRPNAVEPVKECERGIKGRLLVIDAVTPTPDHDAGSFVMLETIQSFQACGWRVSFVPEDNFAHLPTFTSRLQRVGIEALYWPNFKSVDEILANRSDEFDIVLISRVGPASKHLGTVRNRSPKAKVIFNTVDLHFLREQREAELSQNPEAIRKAERTRMSELQAVASSDLTIVHSTVEQDILKRETPQANVSVFPWVSTVRRPTISLRVRRNVLFIGGFRHAPNVDGLRWFLQDIWPRIRAEAPDATFNVIGADAPTEFDAYNGCDGVTMMGWIQNLDPQLDLARVSVAPLRYGAGVKGKVISALSCGLPVVCTSIASEGTGMKHGRDVIVADEPAEFAASVLRLMKNDEVWAGLSESGLRFVEQNYSRKAARERVASMITAVGLKH